MTHFMVHKKRLKLRPCAAQPAHSLDCVRGYSKSLIFIFNFLALSLFISCLPINSQTSVKSSNTLKDILKSCTSMRSEHRTESSFNGKLEQNLNLGEKVDSSFFRQYLLIGNKNRYWKYTSDYLSKENKLLVIPKEIEIELFNNSIIYSSDDQVNKKNITLEKFDFVKIFDNNFEFLYSYKEIISILGQDKEALVFQRFSNKNIINSDFIVNRIWYVHNIGIVQFEVLSKNNTPYLLFNLKEFKEIRDNKSNINDNKLFNRLLITVVSEIFA